MKEVGNIRYVQKKWTGEAELCSMCCNRVDKRGLGCEVFWKGAE